MASFMDLPVELISHILWELKDDHQSLTSVARISPSLHSLVQPALLNSLKFALDDRLGLEILRGNSLNMLQEILTIKPELAPLVQCVDLTYHCHNRMFDLMPEPDIGSQGGLAMISRLLELVPNIQSLKFSAPLFGQNYFQPTFLGGNSMDYLTKIAIHEVTTLPATISTLMCLKRIESMTIGRVTRINPRELPKPSQVGVSPISTLILGSSIVSEDLKSILLVPKELKSLCFAFRYSAEPWNWMGTVLRPSSFMSALSTTQHSLVGLDIQSDEFRPLDIDNTRLDLSNFSCLKTVSVPSNFVFVTYGAHWSRDGLWKLLPPKIETLRITFVNNQILLDRVDVLYGVLLEQLNWLHELPYHKELKYPALSRVVLHENLPNFLQDEAWIPVQIQESFADNHIYLKFYEPLT